MSTLSTTYWWETSQENEYNWDVSDTDITGGGVLPELYGTMRVSLPDSQIIAMTIDADDYSQYLSVLWAICRWNIDDYADVRINGESISVAYPDSAPVTVYYGLNNQPAIADFALTKTLVTVDETLLVSPNWIERSIDGYNTGIGVCLSFPNGLYGQYGSAEEPTYFETSVKILVQYKLHTDTLWTTLTSSNDRPSAVVNSHWSAGYWAIDPSTNYYIFVEIANGSTVRTDHVEGNAYDGIDPDRWILSSYCANTPPPKAYTWHWAQSGEMIVPSLTNINSYFEITEQYIAPFKMTLSRTGLPLGQYDVRVCLYEAPYSSDGTVLYFNTVKFDSYTEILEDNFRYPNVSLLAFKYLATDKLNGSVPEIDLVVAKYYVYAYDPDTSTYIQKPANNPAWVCYDLLHRCRPMQDDSGNWTYEVFGVPHEQLDAYWDLWEAWADWCTYEGDPDDPLELCPNKKPYTFNYLFDQPISLQAALDIAATCGRARVRQVGINFKPIYEHPEVEADIVQRFVFSKGNIEIDSFDEMIDVSPDAANAIEVTYKEQGGSDYTYEDDTVLITWGDDYETSSRDVNIASVTLEGCTNREMAAAYGKYLLNRNRYLTATTSWSANIDAIHCEVGDIVEAPADFAGRILAGSDSGTLYLDNDVMLEPGKTYKVILGGMDDERHEYEVINTVLEPTLKDIISIIDGPDESPAEFTKYLFGEDGQNARLRRIISITRDGDFKRRIVAEEFNSHIFEDDAVIPISPFTPYTWRLRPPAPTITFNSLTWKFDGATKSWIPYINISLSADLSYLSSPVVRLKVWAHIIDGDHHTDPMNVTKYEYFFEWTSSTSIIEAAALPFKGKTLYLTAAYVNSINVTGPMGQQAIYYVDTSFTPEYTSQFEFTDRDEESSGPSAYRQYFSWTPSGWVYDIGTDKWSPIRTWNDGTNYYVFDKYAVVYGIVDTDGDIPDIDKLMSLTTADIGNIYADDGSLITDASTLDTICRNACSSSLVLSYCSKYVAFAAFPMTKNGATSPLDFTAEDYGLDWEWLYVPAPGSTLTVETAAITNFELLLTAQNGAVFLNDMTWDYDLQAPNIDGFAIMYRAQADWWFWTVATGQTISNTETSLANIIAAIDFAGTGGGTTAVNSFAAAYEDWVNRGVPYWFMILSGGANHAATEYEIIKISTTSPYTVTRGVEGTTAKTWYAGASFSYAPCELIDTYIPLMDTTQRHFLLPQPLQINFALHLTICAFKLTAEAPGYKRSAYAFWDIVWIDGVQSSTAKASSVRIPIAGDDGQVKAGNHFVSKNFQYDTPLEWTGLVWDSTGLIAGEGNVGLSGWKNGEQTLLINEYGISKIPSGIGVSYQSGDKPAESAEINIMMPYNITFPTDLADSSYYGAANPTAQQTVSIKKEGVEFATLVVATDGTPIFSGTETEFLQKERFTFAFPATQDDTWAGVSITLTGIRG